MTSTEISIIGRVDKTPQEICSLILDTNQWSNFEGYFILPGINKAEFEKRTDEIIGSKIKVVNTDGSTHTEEIVEWDANKKVVIIFHEFSLPLKSFATHFIEEWKFAISDNGTEVKRSMKMYPKNLFGWLIIKLITKMMSKALEKNLKQLIQPIAK